MNMNKETCQLICAVASSCVYFNDKKGEQATGCAQLQKINEKLSTFTGFPSEFLTNLTFIENEDTSTELFVATSADTIIVAFRGSQESHDWVTDAQCNKANHQDLEGKVHSGFAHCVDSVFDKVEAAILALKNDEKNTHLVHLWFTGHSLGAALAVMAAALWKKRQETHPIDFICVFGCPRVGDKRFVQYYCDKCQLGSLTTRIVNNNDIVTQNPPKMFGYRHVKTLVYITDKGKIVYGQNDEPIPKSVKSDRHWYNFDAADDHKMDSVPNSYLGHMEVQYNNTSGVRLLKRKRGD